MTKAEVEQYVAQFAQEDEQIVFAREIDLYPRTFAPFSLNEICYVMSKIMLGACADEVARLILRAPHFVRKKFFEEVEVVFDLSDFPEEES